MLTELRENPSARLQRPPESERQSCLYRVRIIDNDTNTYSQVIDICMEALNISWQEGFHIALAVDNNGFADVFEGSLPEAEAVASVIRRIGITVEILQIT